MRTFLLVTLTLEALCSAAFLTCVVPSLEYYDALLAHSQAPDDPKLLAEFEQQSSILDRRHYWAGLQAFVLMALPTVAVAWMFRFVFRAFESTKPVEPTG